MHYSNLVIVPAEGDDLDEKLERAMGPSGDDGGFWDWYQIGGRWTGLFDSYDPETDPENTETCTLCAGSGKRPDMTVANGCNGCAGTGTAKKWPTDWKKHPGDIIPVSQLTEEHLGKFHRVVLDGYGEFSSERYEPWAEEKLAKLSMPTLEWIKKEFGGDEDGGYVAVVVDNHS
jgi:hypothetical protein